MGLFSTLITDSVCSHCKQKIELRIQFKFGDHYTQYYKLGDTILWGNRNYGEKNKKLVVVDGVSENCPICGKDEDYYVYIENNIIKNYEQSSGKYDFVHAKSTYLTLKE